VAMMIALQGGIEHFLKNKVDINYSETDNDWKKTQSKPIYKISSRG
jgi:hypothetical protein